MRHCHPILDLRAYIIILIRLPTVVPEAFSVRLANSVAFTDIDVIGATSQDIKDAIAGTVGLPIGSFFMRHIVEVGPPAVYDKTVASYHDRLCGRHDVFPLPGMLRPYQALRDKPMYAL